MGPWDPLGSCRSMEIKSRPKTRRAILQLDQTVYRRDVATLYDKLLAANYIAFFIQLHQ